MEENWFLIKYFSKSKKKYMHTFQNLTINMKTKAQNVSSLTIFISYYEKYFAGKEKAYMFRLMNNKSDSNLV